MKTYLVINLIDICWMDMFFLLLPSPQREEVSVDDFTCPEASCVSVRGRKWANVSAQFKELWTLESGICSSLWNLLAAVLPYLIICVQVNTVTLLNYREMKWRSTVWETSARLSFDFPDAHKEPNSWRLEGDEGFPTTRLMSSNVFYSHRCQNRTLTY